MAGAPTDNLVDAALVRELLVGVGRGTEARVNEGGVASLGLGASLESVSSAVVVQQLLGGRSLLPHGHPP